MNRLRHGDMLPKVRGSVLITRRLIAIIGIVAFAVAFLPEVVGGPNAAETRACCSGAMCPMHHMSTDRVACEMDAGRHGAAFQSCPSHELHYTAPAMFVRVAPPVIGSALPAGAAPKLLLRSVASVDPEVVSPPPRPALA